MQGNAVGGEMASTSSRLSLTHRLHSKMLFGQQNYFDDIFVKAVIAGLHFPVKDDVAFAKVRTALSLHAPTLILYENGRRSSWCPMYLRRRL